MKIVRFVDNWHHYCIQFHEMKPLYTDVNEFTQTKADRKYSYLTCWHGVDEDEVMALEKKIRLHMTISDHVYVDLGEPSLQYKDKSYGWNEEINFWEGPYFGTTDFVNKFQPDDNVTFFGNIVPQVPTNRPLYYLNDMFFESRYIYKENPLCINLLQKINDSKIKKYKWELMCSNNVDLYNELQQHEVMKHTFATCHKLGISHWGPDVVAPVKGTSGAETFDESNLRVSDLIDPSIYNESFYSCVVETNIPADNSSAMFSEKEAKPIITKRPFIIVGSMHHLKSFRKLGFKTFAPVIDESYDNEPNEAKRRTMILDSMLKLCEQDPQEVYEKLKPVLEHNIDHFYNHKWNEELQKAWLTPNLLSE